MSLAAQLGRPLPVAAGDPATRPTGGAPEEVFSEPATPLSGSLRILLWSHFVPSADEWFDPFAQAWGQQVEVDVTVDHINNAEIVPRTTAEIQAGSGHDLIQYIATLAQFEPSVLSLNDVNEETANRWGEQLELCRKSSFNPTTENFYAYSPGWVPDPGDYRKSLWEPAGFPNGPATWDDLLADGTKNQGVPGRTGRHQAVRGDRLEHGERRADVVLRCVGPGRERERHDQLARDGRRRRVHDPAVRRGDERRGVRVGRGLQQSGARRRPAVVHPQLDLGLRTAQDTDPEISDDIFFVPALEGPATAIAAQHVLYNWIVPTHAENPDAAKEFLLHYTANHAAATYHSKLYDLPAWASLVPDRDAWLTNDPFDASPPDKLALLTGATDWSTNIGHPRAGEPGGRGNLQHLRGVEHARPRRPRGTDPRRIGRPGGGGVQQRLRQVARRGAGGRRLTADRQMAHVVEVRNLVKDYDNGRCGQSTGST